MILADTVDRYYKESQAGQRCWIDTFFPAIRAHVSMLQGMNSVTGG